MRLVGTSRMWKFLALLFVGAFLALLFGLLAWFADPHTFLSVLGEKGLVAAAAVIGAGVLMLLIQEITRRTEQQRR